VNRFTTSFAVVFVSFALIVSGGAPAQAAAQRPLVVVGTPATGVVGTPIVLSTTGGSGSGVVSYSVTGSGCSVTRGSLSVTGPTTCIVKAKKAASTGFAVKKSLPVSFIFGIAVGVGPLSTYTIQAQPAAGSCHYRWATGAKPLPDVHCTPGVKNPAVTQATLSSTICLSGYTDTIRPPTNITGPEKIANAAAYSYTDSLSLAEYDHFISLQLGGDPNDPRNLWVQPHDPDYVSYYNAKDTVESRLKTAICDGRITLDQAQKAIVTNWTTALSSLGI